jgi:hypothetical protein
MAKQKEQPVIYLAQVEGAMLARKRQILYDWLDLLKKKPHDKVEYKKQREEIQKQIRDLSFDIASKIDEAYEQNHKVVQQMLMMFVGMDFISRLYDEAADVFKAVTVGIKRNELLDFVALCREVATKANEVVKIIDEPGKDMMSMAYAEMEDNFGEQLHKELREHVDAYGKTPAGKKYFYGEH